MPFRVKNGKNGKERFGKLVQPGIEFPLNVGKEAIAILAVDKDAPNKIHVTNLVGVKLAVKSGPGFFTSTKSDFESMGSDFLVVHCPTRCIFLVIFEEEPFSLPS